MTTTYISNNIKNKNKFLFQQGFVLNIYNKSNVDTTLTKLYIKKRDTNLMCSGSILNKMEIKAVTRIIICHNQTLKCDPTILGLVNFSIFAYHQDSKCFQHIFETLYPGRKYHYDDIIKYFPKIRVNSDQIIDNSLFITMVQASSLKNHHLFSRGNITAIQPLQGKSFSKESMEYKQTGQHNPDCLYEYNIDNKIWSRYLDFKAGQLGFNKGNVFGTSDPELYEYLSKKLINYHCVIYKDNPDILNYLKFLMQKSDLSWGKRNQMLQNFYFDNLHLHNDIMPSFIFFHDVLRENIRYSKILKRYESWINSRSCMNREQTEKTLAICLHEGGPVVMQNYKMQPSNNPNITKYLKDMLIENLDNVMKF